MMQIKFKTPKELNFFEKTKTKLIAVIYEDDDTKKKYPSYYVLSPSETKNEVLKKFDYDKNKKYCFVVLRNSDFIEGRGPMKLDCIWNSKIQAEEYIASKKGIYGSPQKREEHFGNNIYGMMYISIYYNGYDIMKMEIL